MPWELWTKDAYSFYFQEQYLNGVDRNRWHKFKETLRNTDNPRDFAITSCPNHKSKIILEIPDTEYFLAVYLHDKENPHPENGECIILVKIAKLKDFTI